MAALIQSRCHEMRVVVVCFTKQQPVTLTELTKIPFGFIFSMLHILLENDVCQM